MNERARDVLVKAALDGTRQIKFALADGAGGFCAGGVLIDALLQERGLKWRRDMFPRSLTPGAIDAAYGLDGREWSTIVHANNTLGWDFLTIARKVGVQEPPGVPERRDG